MFLLKNDTQGFLSPNLKSFGTFEIQLSSRVGNYSCGNGRISIAEVYRTTFLGFPSIYVFLLWFLYIRFCRIFLRFLFPSSISPEKNVCTKIPLNCKLANKKTWLLALKVGFLSSGKRQRIFLHKNRAPSRKISLFWVFKMVAVSLFRGTNVTVMTSCENPRFVWSQLIPKRMHSPH